MRTESETAQRKERGMRWTRHPVPRADLAPRAETADPPRHRPVTAAVVPAAAVSLVPHLGELTSRPASAALDVMLTIPVAAAAYWAARQVAPALGVSGSRGTSRAAVAAIMSLVMTALFIPVAAVVPLLHAIVDGAAMSTVDVVAAAGQALAIQPIAFAACLLVLLPTAPAPYPHLAHRHGLGVRLGYTGAAVAVVAGQFTGPAVPPASADDTATASCATAPKRTYTVYAINVDITIDRFGDHDPFGFMYVLADDLNAVRAQEAALEKAAAPGADPATGAKVSNGLRQDPIQPLVLRARLGECVSITLTNKLTQPPKTGPGFGDTFVTTQPGGVPSVSVDVAGVSHDAAGGAGGQAVGNDPGSVMVPPGGSD